MTSPFQDFKYEMGEEYICPDFDENINNPCSNGFYATDLNGLPYSFNVNKEVFACEVSGKSVELDQFKRRYEKISLTKKVSHSNLRALVKDYKCDYDLLSVLFPTHPLKLKPKKLQKKDMDNLKKWVSVWASFGASVWVSVRASVRASVGESVGASVGTSVWTSVGTSVWGSVGDSVVDSVWESVGASVWGSVWTSIGDSVGDSVGAYISSVFPNIKKWKYVDHHEDGVNPFWPCIDLWKRGFVPSFDGKTWRLHQGKDAKIIYEEKF